MVTLRDLAEKIFQLRRESKFVHACISLWKENKRIQGSWQEPWKVQTLMYALTESAGEKQSSSRNTVLGTPQLMRCLLGR